MTQSASLLKNALRRLAVATRKRILHQCARGRLMVAGMHPPFTGVGHVRKEASGYAWVPAELAPLAK